jgi:exonuclease SbcC
VETTLAVQRAEYEAAVNAMTTLTQVRTALAGCEQQLESEQKSLDTARAAATEATAKSVAAESTWAERATQVPENLRDPAALEKLLAQARANQESLSQSFKRAQEAYQSAQSQQAAAIAALKTRQEAAAESQLRLNSAEEAFIAALAQHGFVDEPAFVAAKLVPEAIVALAQRIRQHDQALATAQDRLTRAATAVAGIPPPNLEELLESRNNAQGKLEAVLAEQNKLQAKNAERVRTAEMLEEIRLELGDISKRYQVMGHLAEIANGKNTNITFQRYVLAALLDNVLIQASQRLRKMTSNRYTLQRFKDVSDKRRAAGLDIEVFDEQTGTARSANTLSGGEGFMASLSLALGLSDVVQSYAGGIQLDTLFIDEGFGTLDPESLDMAMKALIELQQKGRLVGIISHVDELKQQLEHGIEIRFAAGGSSARVGAIAA